MLFLVLLQTLLLLCLAGLVLYWRLETNRRLDGVNLLEAKRLSALSTVQASMALLQAEIAELRVEKSDSANCPDDAPPPSQRIDPHPQPASVMSIHKRSQALKMIRRGDSVELISAAVDAPQSQIRLLQKVHALIDVAS